MGGHNHYHSHAKGTNQFAKPIQKNSGRKGLQQTRIGRNGAKQKADSGATLQEAAAVASAAHGVHVCMRVYEYECAPMSSSVAASVFVSVSVYVCVCIFKCSLHK